MSVFNQTSRRKGFSLIEVIIVIAILSMVFAGLFAGFEYSLKLIAHSRAKMSAVSLATDRSEYLRSLPYDAVGTVSGIPNGAIPQNRTVRLNDIDFAERVLVEYVDDPADGSGAADSNSVVADYKRYKIEYTWTIYGTTQSFSLVSTVSPRSIETLAGGGTLRVNVFDAAVNPLPGASVRLVNNTGTTSIDVTRTTDATGVALFTGAPAVAGYNVYVFGAGYSSDQTRSATTSLPFPATQPFAVLDADVSTMNFQIDRVSDMTVQVYASETTAAETETFADLLAVSASSSVTATSGVLQLEEVAGVYAASGSVLLPILPASIAGWGVIKITKTTPATTDARVRVYDSASTSSLLPESVLPGNTAGFAGDYISLTTIDAAIYPELVLGIELATGDTSITPTVDEVEVAYASARTPLANNDFTIRGAKVIGADASAQNVYKFDKATSTDASGERVFSDIEWDTYTVTLDEGYDVAEACSGLPYYLEPNSEAILTIRAVNGGTNNLRVLAMRGDGSPIHGAAVELDDTTGGVTLREVGWCGQAFFPSLNSSIGYSLSVGAPGFATTTIASTTVSGVVYQEVILTP
jgi:prepilin-type N-terminal cleavage/methylation domain-containing protein